MKGRSTARVTGAGTKFRLLMWKNFLQQWRHRVQTCVEVILPVLTLALVLILRSQIEPTVESVMTYPALPAHTLNYSLNVLAGMNFSQLSIAYSPESPVLERVMRRATAKLITRNLKGLIQMILDQYPDYADMIPPDLELPDLSEIPINGTLITEIIERIVGLRVYAYNSSESLRGLYSSEEVTRHVIAGVEFDDELTGATQLSSNLRYSLRFPERPRQFAFYSRGSQSWHTDLTFPSFQIPGPRNPYSWEGGNAPGNTEITSGSVWVAGYDISQQTAAARANLGFCPQHNVLFNELTVREHLEFFGRLKGFTGQDLRPAELIL